MNLRDQYIYYKAQMQRTPEYEKIIAEEMMSYMVPELWPGSKIQPIEKYDFYAKYPPWIDILLVLRSVNVVSCAGVIPHDVIVFIVCVYFELIRPKFACSEDFAVMHGRGREVITWHLHLHLQINPLGSLGPRMVMDMRNVLLHPAYRQVGHLIPEGVNVACGPDFVIGYTRMGRYVWGSNDLGQLGSGDCITPIKPVYVASANEIIAVSAGDAHVMMLVLDIPTRREVSKARDLQGSAPMKNDFGANRTEPTRETMLIGWGYNDGGCLGDIDTDKVVLRRKICGFGKSDPLSAVCGDSRSLVLTRDGVWLYGNEFAHAGHSIAPAKLALPVEFAGLTRLTRMGFAHKSILLWDGDVCWSCDDVSAYGDDQVGRSGGPFTIDADMNGKYAEYFDCVADGARNLLDLFDPRTLPGRMLTISGSGLYLIVVTTRGAYACIANGEGQYVVRHLCVL